MAIKYTKTDELDKMLADFLVDVNLDQEEIARRSKIAEDEAQKFIDSENKAKEKKDEK